MSAPTIKDYSDEEKARWDAFVARSKNGTFLFQREYMDYHADRFPDASLMAVDDTGAIRALLPATRRGNEIISHAGLTYGGFVTDQQMTVGTMLDLFGASVRHLQQRGVTTLVYKPVPHIYHTSPAEEDLYALFVHGAQLYRRDVTSVIDYGAEFELKAGRRRRRRMRKATRAGVDVRESNEYERFWPVLEANLDQRYGTRPVHSLEEIQSLAERFPAQIRLYGAYLANELEAGVVVYLSDCVCHVQYSATSRGGQRARCARPALSAPHRLLPRARAVLRLRYLDRAGRSFPERGACRVQATFWCARGRSRFLPAHHRRPLTSLEQYAKRYIAQFADKSFETRLVAVRHRHVLRWLEDHNARRVLEVGCGFEPLFSQRPEFDSWRIVEPITEFVRRARELAAGDNRVEVWEGYLEDHTPVLASEDFDFIVVSSVVHGVPDPARMLEAVRSLCGENTVAHFSVPNMLSFHRLLALEMGLIRDVFQPSARDRDFGHHAQFDRGRFIGLLESAGFRVVESGTYFVKPFSHDQMDAMLSTGAFPPSLIDGLDRMIRYMPEHGCELYANARRA